VFNNFVVSFTAIKHIRKILLPHVVSIYSISFDDVIVKSYLLENVVNVRSSV